MTSILLNAFSRQRELIRKTRLDSFDIFFLIKFFGESFPELKSFDWDLTQSCFRPLQSMHIYVYPRLVLGQIICVTVWFQPTVVVQQLNAARPLNWTMYVFYKSLQCIIFYNYVRSLVRTNQSEIWLLSTWRPSGILRMEKHTGIEYNYLILSYSVLFRLQWRVQPNEKKKK